MRDGTPNYAATRRLLELCFEKYYKRVIIESFHCYASPGIEALRKAYPKDTVVQWDVPFWKFIRKVGAEFRTAENPMGCGNGNMVRGDEAQVHRERLFFAPGVYEKDHIPKWDHEKEAARAVQASMLDESHDVEPYCKHGGRQACISMLGSTCFKDWGVF